MGGGTQAWSGKIEGKQKWVVLVAGCIVQLTLGGLYTWGNETIYFTSWLRQYDPSLTYETTLFTFGTATVALAIGGIPGGLFLARFGPRAIGVFGSIIYAASVYCVVLVRSFTGLVFVYGILRGTAIGIAHVPPVAVCALYFPGNVGFIQGVVAAFYGMGGFVLNFVTTAVANPNNLSPVDDPSDPDYEYYPRDGEVVGNVVKTWMVLGSIIATGIIAAWFVVNPPGFKYEILESVDEKNCNEKDGSTTMEKHPLADVVEENERLIEKILGDDCGPNGDKMRKLTDGSFSSSSSGTRSSFSGSTSSEKEVVNLRQDWGVWEAVPHPQYILVTLMFILGTIPGHVVLGRYKNHGPGDDAFLTLVGSFGAMANGLGRIFFGMFTDYVPKKFVLCFMFGVQIVFCVVYPWIVDGKAEFTVVVLALHFLYGGNFAVFPALVWEQFGKTYFGAIYAVMLAAWGLGGLAGDTLVNIIEKPYGIMWMAITLAIISAIATLCTFFVNSFPNKDHRWRWLFGCERESASRSQSFASGYDENLLKKGLA